MYYRLPMDPLFIYIFNKILAVVSGALEAQAAMFKYATCLNSIIQQFCPLNLSFFVLIRCKNIMYHNTNITRCKLADTNKIPFIRFFSAKLWSINSEVYIGLFLFISCCVHIHTCTKFCKQTSHPYMYEWLVKQTTLFLGMIKLYWECVLILLSYTCW